MKPLLFAVFCLIICSATTCKKEGENCHKKFVFKNNSSDTIIFALIWTTTSYSTEPRCQLNGSKIAPKMEGGLGQRDCWEDILANGKTQEIFIVDLAKYNAPLVFYDCDSLELKNKILKHYILTIDSLRKYNFTIIYP